MSATMKYVELFAGIPSEGSLKELHKPIAINMNPRTPTRPTASQGGSGVLMKEDEMFCLQTQPHFVEMRNVSDSPKSLHSPSESSDTTTQMSVNWEVQPTLIAIPSQTSTFSAVDFLAKVGQLLESDKGLMMPEALCFLRSHGFYHTKDPDIFYSKTLKVYLVLTADRLSRKYLGFSPNSITGWKQLYLIQKTTGFPKIGNGCSLSDILETNVDEKYYLSETTVKNLLKDRETSVMPSTPIMPKEMEI